MYANFSNHNIFYASLKVLQNINQECYSLLHLTLQKTTIGFRLWESNFQFVWTCKLWWAWLAQLVRFVVRSWLDPTFFSILPG